jgi:hypothetical protein
MSTITSTKATACYSLALMMNTGTGGRLPSEGAQIISPGVGSARAWIFQPTLDKELICMSDVPKNDEFDKPKRRPSWFRWNWDDFIAETDHLGHVAHSAATRLMGALFRTEDYTLPDDPKVLTRIIRGRNQSRVKWGDGLKEELAGVIDAKDGRISSPWLTLKCSQAAGILSLKWSHAPDKPLKEKTPTSPNREFRIKNSESKATTAAKARSMAEEKEASKGEQAEKPPTPEEKARVLAKMDAHRAALKRAAVKQNLGITEGDMAPYMEVDDEHHDDASGRADDAGGTVA